jgi:hypothetical protein
MGRIVTNNTAAIKSSGKYELQYRYLVLSLPLASAKGVSNWRNWL